MYKRQEDGYAIISVKTYIKNVTDRIEKLLEVSLKKYGSPMEAGDHPEQDETDLLPTSQIPIYQMLIGCAQWAVTLGRFDIQYATNTLACHSCTPREGHLTRCMRLFGYLKYYKRAKIIMDPSPLNLDELKFEDHDWTDLYPNAQEHLPDTIPQTYNKEEMILTVFMDASHATCQMTRRSVTGYVIFLGNTPIKTYSKRQNTIETSSYGSELVALRIALEGLLEIRYKLRMMGINFNETSPVLCDNMGVVTNMQFPTSSLKKKHNAVAYHKIREAVAAKIIVLAHIRSEQNIAGILTKAVGPGTYYNLLGDILFG